MKKKFTYFIHVKGLVQGIGFRPFIYRIAKSLLLTGSVENTNDGVYIFLNTSNKKLNKFLEKLKKETPPAAQIHQINIKQIPYTPFDNFVIVKSTNRSTNITEVSPDIAVCKDCLHDMKTQPHRLIYPFINCTNCGPRYSIIKDLPYDRDQTTMSVFEMCAQCRSEYENIEDRRFHAQPIACNNCGPNYILFFNNTHFEDLILILKKVSCIISNGGVLAIKGLGGYFLCCDAQNETAVRRLREIKQRDYKPFAVMFRNLDVLKKFAHVNETEEAFISSWQRPITILKIRKPLAYSISLELSTVGAMLPYMPFHYLLFEHTNVDTLVMTSGNISETPIIIDNTKSIEAFVSKCDGVLTYNREIQNRIDDSVTFIENNNIIFIRRARGFAPASVFLNCWVEGIFASGSELNNTFCIGKENKGIVSQHIGDLKNAETMDFYIETFECFKRLFRFDPKYVACDAHPDYLSTKFAQKLGLPVLYVQHHHAHITSCMAEHNLSGKVIGVAFDGTGYGTDHTIWGSEFMVCDYHSFERIYNLEYLPLPGGDKVTLEPWRTSIAILYKIFGNDLTNLRLQLLEKIEQKKLLMIIEMLNKNINCPMSCGAGRYFDAVAALLNICIESKFHAQAPMLLETVAKENEHNTYNFKIKNNQVIMTDVIEQIIDDIKLKIEPSVISAKFHNTMVSIITQIAETIREQTGLNNIILTGGVFQNRLLLKRSMDKLKDNNFQVFIQNKYPINDAGISLGQLVIASHFFKS